MDIHLTFEFDLTDLKSWR